MMIIGGFVGLYCVPTLKFIQTIVHAYFLHTINYLFDLTIILIVLSLLAFILFGSFT